MSVKGKYLGEFEELVLLALGALGNDSYGIAIKNKLEESMGRKVSIGALHAALNRLELKNLVSSRLGEATKIRGGKRKRNYSVSIEGQQLLSTIMTKRQELWESISADSFSVRWNVGGGRNE